MLTKDIYWKISEFLDHNDLLRFGMVCKSFNKFSMDRRSNISTLLDKLRAPISDKDKLLEFTDPVEFKCFDDFLYVTAEKSAIIEGDSIKYSNVKTYMVSTPKNKICLSVSERFMALRLSGKITLTTNFVTPGEVVKHYSYPNVITDKRVYSFGDVPTITHREVYDDLDLCKLDDLVIQRKYIYFNGVKIYESDNPIISFVDFNNNLILYCEKKIIIFRDADICVYPMKSNNVITKKTTSGIVLIGDLILTKGLHVYKCKGIENVVYIDDTRAVIKSGGKCYLRTLKN